jgi:hypothetical protein
VWLAQGVYRPAAPLRIEGDFGPGGLRLVAAPGDKVEIVGADPVDPQPAAQLAPGEAARIAPEVLARLRVIPLEPLGALAGANDAAALPNAGIMLFQGDRALTPARWPASGYAVAPARFPAGERRFVRFPAPPEKTSAWKAQEMLWAEGFWTSDYNYERRKFSLVDDATVQVMVGEPSGPKSWLPKYAVFNALEDLSRPGTYAVRDDPPRLLVLPFEENAPLERARLETVLGLDGAARVVVEGISFGKVSGTAVTVRNSTEVRIADSAVGWSGETGIAVAGGQDIAIVRTVVHDSGGRGITLAGGDRTTLAPSGHRVEDSIVIDFGQVAKTYHPGIGIAGVGAQVRSSLITRGPHAGIIFYGNDHAIEGNELSHLILEGGDAGAIYVGRDWTQRGTVIRGNFFHDIAWRIPPAFGHWSATVYLDDYTSGTSVTDNVFFKVSLPVLIGGGRDNEVVRNAFVETRPQAIMIDSRGETFGRESLADPRNAPRRNLRDVPIDSPAYVRRYPNLANILSDEPEKPKYNTVQDNLFFNSAPYRMGGSLFDRNAIERPTEQSVPAGSLSACPGRADSVLAFLGKQRGAPDRYFGIDRRSRLGGLKYFDLVRERVMQEGC